MLAVEMARYKTEHEMPTFHYNTVLGVFYEDHSTQTEPSWRYTEISKTWIVATTDFVQAVRILVHYCNCVVTAMGFGFVIDSRALYYLYMVLSRPNSTILNILCSTCIISFCMERLYTLQTN